MRGAQAWTGERVVDRESAARLITSRFPGLTREHEVEPLAEGWDSTVFTVGPDWAFQFPRRVVVIPGLRRVIDILPQVAPALPLAVSAPELVADDDDRDPWPFVGCRFIPGVELADAGLSQAGRVPVAAAVGGFLRSLHAYDTSALRDSLPVDPNGRGLPAGSLDYTLSVLGLLAGEESRRGRDRRPGAHHPAARARGRAPRPDR